MSTRAPDATPSTTTPPASAAPRRACASPDAGLRLRDDLEFLRREVARLPDLVVQLRHHDARLVTARSLSELGSGLRLPTRATGPVVGHSAPCACCGSPGRIALHDAADREFLQLCATADCAPSIWMDLLLDLLPRPADHARRSLAARPDRMHLPPSAWSDSAPFDADPRAAQALCRVLNNVWSDPFALEIALRIPGASLAVPFAPDTGSVEHGLLTLRSADATLQLLLPAVTRLRIRPSGLDPVLAVETRVPGERVTLRSTAPAWRRALADLAVEPR